MSELTADDRWSIQQTLSAYGHIVDNGEWDRLAEIFTPDARILGPAGAFTGPAGAREHEESAHAERIAARHTVNTVTRPGSEPDTAVAWSRVVLVTYAQAAQGGDYLDVLRREGGVWRIAERRIADRNLERPGGEYSTVGAIDFAAFEAAE